MRPAAKLIAEKGIWLSTQPFPDEIANSFPVGSQEQAKALEVLAGTDRTYKLAKKYHLKTAFGTRRSLLSVARPRGRGNSSSGSPAGTRRLKHL